MIVKVEASSINGIDSRKVLVEVDVGQGLPSFSIVGLADTVCKESQVRVRAAIKNSGFHFPSKKITVNLAPADVKKEGSGFDLPIAIGILAASGQIDKSILNNTVYVGELALDGLVRPVSGMLAHIARFEDGKKRFVLPQDNLAEAACVQNARILPASDLKTCIKEAISNAEKPGIQWRDVREEKKVVWSVDFSDVRGQLLAKRGIEIACAGGHNLIAVGPPGSGKTMLAKRIPTILSELSFRESLETTKVHSIAGKLQKAGRLLRTSPFQSPHHSISDVALIGGGTHPRPGEISLAHNGILFLDEIPEFRRNVLEVLRQPLEERRVTVSRAASTVVFPANFMLVAAMNPCPCGYYSDKRHACYCTPVQIKRYMSKVSGPLMDRIDIHIFCRALSAKDFKHDRRAEDSAAIQKRVLNAREIQKKRYSSIGIRFNAELQGRQVEDFCLISDELRKYLEGALEKLGFSGRAYHKILKVARTIADLSQKDEIEQAHIEEAVQFRSLDRMYTI